MKDYTFTQQFALIGLNGLDSLHASTAKMAVMRGIVAAEFLENYWKKPEGKGQAKEDAKKLQEAWKQVSDRIHRLNKKEAQKLETTITAPLKAEGVLEEVQDILACDINYDTAGVDIKVYRADAEVYGRIVEGIRAEILEEGPISAECFGFLWLMRESCCIHDHFSQEEQKRIEQRMLALKEERPMYQVLWEEEFHSTIENTAVKLLKGKINMFKNPYLQGVNLLFPYLNRRSAIFIDFVVLGTTVADRRIAVMEYLSRRGHYVEEVKNGTETLLRIDNNYYRIWPTSRCYYKIPVQGAELLPVYK